MMSLSGDKLFVCTFVIALTFQSPVVVRLGRASPFCGTAILGGAILNPNLLHHRNNISYYYIPKQLLRSLYIVENIEYVSIFNNLEWFPWKLMSYSIV